MSNARLCSLLMIVLLAACKQSAHQYQLKALEQSVQQVSDDMKAHASRSYRRIEDRWYNPRHRFKAEIWLPKATHVKKVSGEAIAYLDSLKQALTADHKDLSTLLQLADGTFPVYSRLLQYKKELLTVLDTTEFKDNERYLEQLRKDIRMFDRFMPLLPADTSVITASQKIRFIKRWTDNHFGNASARMALLMLNKLQNDVWQSQIDLTDYLYSQIPSNWCGYTFYRGIAMISSQYMKTGQALNIYTGVGRMDLDCNPRVYIQDSAILVDYPGCATHRFKVPEKPGKYTIPVRFEYEEFGIIKTHTQNIEYIIAP